MNFLQDLGAFSARRFGTSKKQSQNANAEELGPTRYKSVGHCIYCDSTENLTDEHIVPYGLNGNWVLPRSSCRKCANVTGAIVEQEILRGELRHLRAALQFQSRHKKERPQTVRLTSDQRHIDVPIDQCPILMPFVRFPRPRLLEGEPSRSGINVSGSVMIRWGPDPEAFMRARGLQHLSLSKEVAPAMFARMLAKIAFAYVIARFGVNALHEEFVRGVILGSDARLGDVVGCASSEDDYALNDPNGHVLKPVVYKRGPYEKLRLLAVRVKLFAGAQTPTYEVVVGKPIPSLESAAEKFSM